MTSRLSSRGLGKRLAMITATAALALGLGAGSAFAASVEVSPNSGLSATETTEVTITGSGYEASNEYEVGLCSAETYGIFGVPACGEPVGVVANGSGEISTSLVVQKTTFNVHSQIPFPWNLGQPETFVCAGNPEEDDECEIWAIDHEETQIEATTPVSFE